MNRSMSQLTENYLELKYILINVLSHFSNQKAIMNCEDLLVFFVLYVSAE